MVFAVSDAPRLVAILDSAVDADVVVAGAGAGVGAGVGVGFAIEAR